MTNRIILKTMLLPLSPTETIEQIQFKKLKQKQQDELSKTIQIAECIAENLDRIRYILR